MGILCNWFGHKFVHVGSEAHPCWSRMHFAGGGTSDWYRTLRVPKECVRCGYRHADSFLVPAEWPELNELSGDSGQLPAPPADKGVGDG